MSELKFLNCKKNKKKNWNVYNTVQYSVTDTDGSSNDVNNVF